MRVNAQFLNSRSVFEPPTIMKSALAYDWLIVRKRIIVAIQAFQGRLDSDPDVSCVNMLTDDGVCRPT